jgi:hypothetical protein
MRVIGIYGAFVVCVAFVFALAIACDLIGTTPSNEPTNVNQGTGDSQTDTGTDTAAEPATDSDADASAADTSGDGSTDSGDGTGDTDGDATVADTDSDATPDAGSGAEPDTDADATTAGLLADHLAATAFEAIPSASVTAAASGDHIFYGHTSHGSQIVTGIDMVAAEHAGYPASSALSLREYDGDLGTEGDLTWEGVTRGVLAEPGNGINLVLWAWCGGVSGNTTDGINAYLNAMDQLERDYPAITFIYMTGHLDGTGPSENLYRGNNQIRAWCRAHGKTLFDFADIESYDPAGNYYPDGSDWCEWCETWCTTHACPTCGDCAHSQCINCYQKGRAFWWLLARLAGWNGE